MRQFTVICSKQDYDEVAEILERWGYESYGTVWLPSEDCVVTSEYGDYMTFYLATTMITDPRYTLEELRGMENPNL